MRGMGKTGWTRRGAIALAAGMGMGATTRAARAAVPPARLATLARGVNVAHWFRFPPDTSAPGLRDYMDDAAIAALRAAGFTWVRLAVGPEEVMRGARLDPARRDAVVAAVQRLQRAGLGVMVEPHPQQVGNWNLQDQPAARERLLGFWRDLAPALARLPTDLTFPEVVNEPQMEDPALWDRLQAELLGVIRAAMPEATVILTGINWSSIDGLLRVTPVADRNVIYSFHTYEPQLLALLAGWEQGVDTAALGRLPFPAADRRRCEGAVAGIAHARTQAIANYWCSERRDATTVAANLRRAAAWGRRHGVAVAMTEFGASPALNAPAREAYLEAVRRAAEAERMPWALWALDDSMGFGVRPGRFTARTELTPGVLRALGLPVAGLR
jgi:hypothetical protein